jgi:hypothetical protein
LYNEILNIENDLETLKIIFGNAKKTHEEWKILSESVVCQV